MQEFLIRFMCQGASQGWAADTAKEARMVIDVLSGAIKPDEFLQWIMLNLPQHVDGAVTMINACVVIT